jgi:hypothetical protein
MPAALVGAAILAAAAPAAAAGELNIFNWGNYTNPELIKKFEEAYDVKVTLTDYDSNTTALTKVKPIVMFGTKWPSMTSTWIKSAPPRSAAAIDAPSAAKSADRIEGAMRTTLPLNG